MSSSSYIEVTDRRPHSPDRPAEVETTPAKGVIEPSPAKGEWRSVGYMLVLLAGPNGAQIPAVRAAGTRASDGQTFVADTMFMPVLSENWNWKDEVKRRLDTFLDCPCKMTTHCGLHVHYLKQWAMADQQKFEMAAKMPVPESLEVLFRAEHEKAPRIVKPGR